MSLFTRQNLISNHLGQNLSISSQLRIALVNCTLFSISKQHLQLLNVSEFSNSGEKEWWNNLAQEEHALTRLRPLERRDGADNQQDQEPQDSAQVVAAGVALLLRAVGRRRRVGRNVALRDSRNLSWRRREGEARRRQRRPLRLQVGQPLRAGQLGGRRPPPHRLRGRGQEAVASDVVAGAAAAGEGQVGEDQAAAAGVGLRRERRRRRGAPPDAVPAHHEQFRESGRVAHDAGGAVHAAHGQRLHRRGGGGRRGGRGGRGGGGAGLQGAPCSGEAEGAAGGGPELQSRR